MGTRLDPTANERTAYADSLCQILTYARGPEEVTPAVGRAPGAQHAHEVSRKHYSSISR